MKKRFAAALAIGLLVIGMGGTALAVQFTFKNIVPSYEDLSGQLFVDVTQNGSLVDFKFTNIVGIQSSVEGIYFDFPDVNFMTFSGMADSGDGVSFSVGATPPKLPEWKELNPDFITSFATDSDNPVVAKGVNKVSEWLTLSFTPSSGFQGVINALNSGALRIGLHVQGIGTSGGSDSYVNNPGAPVPEPATMLLFGAGLAGLAGVARRKKNG